MEGFDAQSIAGMEAAERARLNALERREAWRKEQEGKRLIAEEAKQLRASRKKKVREPPKMTVDGLEMLMGFRWHDGFRWHEGVQPPKKNKNKKKKKKKKKKLVQMPPALSNNNLFGSMLLAAVVQPPGQGQGQENVGSLHYNPATRTIRQKPRQVLPSLKGPLVAVPKPTVMMNKGNIEITDKKEARRIERGGASDSISCNSSAVIDSMSGSGNGIGGGGAELRRGIAGGGAELRRGIAGGGEGSEQFLPASETNPLPLAPPPSPPLSPRGALPVKHSAFSTGRGAGGGPLSNARGRSGAGAGSAIMSPSPPGREGLTGWASPGGEREQGFGVPEGYVELSEARGVPAAVDGGEGAPPVERAAAAPVQTPIIPRAAKTGLEVARGLASGGSARKAKAVAPAAAEKEAFLARQRQQERLQDNAASAAVFRGTVSAPRAAYTRRASQAMAARVPAKALKARAGTRAWSPRLMTAGANGGAGFRGFVQPTRPGTPKQQQSVPGYIHIFNASQRGVGTVILPPRASTARPGPRAGPPRHHGASSIMTARPATAGQVF